MAENIYLTIIKAIRDAGSKDPFLNAEILGILPIDIYGGIIGYAAVYNR